MNVNNNSKYRIITISGKYATGTSTLAKNLIKETGWKYINLGDIQREYDRQHNIDENKQGALSRPDEHEKEMDATTKKILKKENKLIYESWLSGFNAQGIDGILKVLLICSDEAIRIDRVVNRDGLTIDQAKEYIKQREEENEKKWKKLYGDYNFWDSKYFDIIIDTYSSGPMETLGKVLDKLNL
jgi:cytidylate kinase